MWRGSSRPKGGALEGLNPEGGPVEGGHREGASASERVATAAALVGSRPQGQQMQAVSPVAIRAAVLRLVGMLKKNSACTACFETCGMWTGCV